MKTAKLIEKLQKIESENPGSEIDFLLEGMGSTKEFPIGFTGLAKSRNAEGVIWLLRFFTDRALPK